MLGTLLELLYPTECPACGRPSGGDGALCEDCRAALPIRTQENCCAICGKTLLADERAAGTAVAECAQCHKKRPAFDLARSAVLYKGPVRPLVHELKYHHGLYVAKDLMDLLEGCYRAHYGNETTDFIVPIPLHRHKKTLRGYNQSAILARQLAKRIGVPVAEKFLRRRLDTETQTHMSADERRTNMKGAFEVPERYADYVYGKRVLLLDDVMTTGATFGEAARALRAAGAGRIVCLSLARD